MDATILQEEVNSNLVLYLLVKFINHSGNAIWCRLSVTACAGPFILASSCVKGMPYLMMTMMIMMCGIRHTAGAAEADQRVWGFKYTDHVQLNM